MKREKPSYFGGSFYFPTFGDSSFYRLKVSGDVEGLTFEVVNTGSAVAMGVRLNGDEVSNLVAELGAWLQDRKETQ